MAGPMASDIQWTLKGVLTAACTGIADQYSPLRDRVVRVKAASIYEMLIV